MVVPADLPADLSLPANTTKAALNWAGCWAAPLIFEPGETSARNLVVWPSGSINGKIVLSSQQERHDVIHVRSLTESLPFSVDCPVRGALFSCSLPATTLDMRFDLEGSIPNYVWATHIPVHGTLRLSDLQFVRGASLSGWVVAADRARLTHATIEITPVSAASDSPKTVRYRATTNERGFFQVRALPIGRYTVVAKAHNGYASFPVEVQVREKGEAESPALVLKAPETLTLFITPPVAPNGRPWMISLQRALPFTTAGVLIDKSPGTMVGEWHRDKLSLGQYWIAIEDDAGSRFERQSVQIGAGSPAFLSIALPIVRIRGRVTVGDAPAAQAKLAFSSSLRPVGIKTVTDEAGRFEGALPEEGDWRIGIALREAGATTARFETIKRRDDGGTVQVDIRLPAGRLKGTVVDDTDMPTEADVTVFNKGVVVAHTRSGEDGQFAIVGLDPADDELAAMNRTGRSDIVPHTITDDDSDSVILHLKRLDVIHGRVLDTAGSPVAGALVRYEENGLFSEIGTGPHGEFELKTVTSTGVAVAVLSAGFPVKITMLASSADRESIVVLGLQSGVVNIHYNPPSMRLMPYIVHNGATARLDRLLFPFTSSPPSELTADGFALLVEPGTYAMCPGSSPSPRCVEAIVSPGSKADLTFHDNS